MGHVVGHLVHPTALLLPRCLLPPIRCRMGSLTQVAEPCQQAEEQGPHCPIASPSSQSEAFCPLAHTLPATLNPGPGLHTKPAINLCTSRKPKLAIRLCTSLEWIWIWVQPPLVACTVKAQRIPMW